MVFHFNNCFSLISEWEDMGMKQDTPSGLWCYCLGQSWCSALCALLFTQTNNNLLLNEFENNLYAYSILFDSPPTE
jgi:hypothetical protein